MTGAASDEDLLASYAAGDARAFGELYDRHERATYRFFRRQGASSAQADDLMQETWLAVVRSAANFEPRARFTTWLFTVARNKMIDQWRTRDIALSLTSVSGGDEAANDSDEPMIDVPAGDADRPDHQAIARAEARAFVAAVEALPAAQREAFLLQAEGGLSLDEIAAATGVERETVKSRLRYAMNKLRPAMEAWQ